MVASRRGVESGDPPVIARRVASRRAWPMIHCSRFSTFSTVPWRNSSGMKLKKLVGLPGADRLRLAQALVLLVTVGIGLRIVAFRRLWRLLDAWARREGLAAGPDGVQAHRV